MAPDARKVNHLLSALECVELFRTAIDIGAYDGVYTCILAGRFERVIAYEPFPSSYAMLCRNTSRFDHVDPVFAAVLDAPASDLVIRRKAKTHAPNDQGLYVDFGNSDDPIAVAGVSAVALDGGTLLNARVDFLKIDVEGLELRVLKGAADTIDRDKPVIMIELVERYLKRRGGTSTKEVEAWLAARGYHEMSRMGEDGVWKTRSASS